MKTKSTNGTRESINWLAVTDLCARDAYENNFASRRGTYIVELFGAADSVVCIYDNNPYKDDATKRDRETDDITRRLAAIGVETLAYSTYPKDGVSAGYTYAMLVDADVARHNEVREVVYKALFDEKVGSETSDRGLER